MARSMNPEGAGIAGRSPAAVCAFRAAARLAAVCLAAAGAALGSAAAAAQPVAVDLELAFVVDASGSIDEEEMRLQRQGYAAALADPRVLGAIESGFLQAIAISYIEFAASGCIRQRVGWTKIDGAASARAAGEAILAAPREYCPGGNAIGEAVAFAVGSTLDNRFDGTRKVIDISGDGPNTIGTVPIGTARADALARGFTINGLVIERPSMPDLPDYFRAAVTGGPRSFVIMAESRRTFADAILRKMILEIAGRPPAPRPDTEIDPARQHAAQIPGNSRRTADRASVPPAR